VPGGVHLHRAIEAGARIHISECNGECSTDLDRDFGLLLAALALARLAAAFAPQRVFHSNRS
jgi:hypothetical protein